MTNKEAREILERYIRCSNSVCPPVDCNKCHRHVTAKQLDEALQVALEALKEPKQPDHIAEASKKDGENGDDLIRREDALMSLTGEWTESRDEILSKAIRRIKRLPSVKPDPQWIPCKKKLPDDSTYVLTTIKAGKREPKVRSGFYHSELFSNDNGDCWKATDKEVVAWMKTPDPYGGEQDE